MKFLGRELKFRKNPQKERRQAERLKASEILYVDFCHRIETVIGTAEGVDISETGISFAFENKFSRGAPLDLMLRYPGSEGAQRVVRLHGMVVRSEKKKGFHRYRTACVFPPLEPDTQKEVRAFMNWLKEVNAG